MSLPQHPCCERFGVRRGFSLVEVLVVLGVIAMLVAIVVPVISGSRDRARLVEVLSKVQHAGVSMPGFAGSNGQRFPVVLPREGSDSPIVEMRTPDAKMTTHYFAQLTLWNVAIKALGGGLFEGSQRVERAPVVAWTRPPSDFYFGHSFMTEPGYGEPGASQTRAMWRAASVSEVLFPAQKAMLHDPEQGASGAAIVFVEGRSERPAGGLHRRSAEHTRREHQPRV